MGDIRARLNAALDGRYILQRELGEGGMATVYLAHDVKHARQVAVKVLKPEISALIGADRFQAEIKTTAHLQDPRILPLFDSGEADGYLYFVMPHVEGETLRHRLDRDGQLPVSEAVHIAVTVAHALHHAHEVGVVHRDIKPANILITHGEPLVADFGIALDVDDSREGRLTQPGFLVGTPYYMSPEQASGEGSVGPASDTYSLACVLFEMLAGRPPYPGSTPTAVLGQIMQGTPASVTEFRRSVPRHVDAALRKALERLPADRFTTTGQFAEALEDPAFRYASGGPSGSPALVQLGSSATRFFGATSVLLLLSLFWALGRASDPPPTVTQELADIWRGVDRPIGSRTALAPDGSGMVFSRAGDDGQNEQLWYKARELADAVPLSGTSNARNVVFSPDSRRIAFVVDEFEIRTRGLGDGVATTVARDAASGQVGLAWMDDGTILYETSGLTIVRIPEDGGGRPDTLAVWPDMQQLAYIGGLSASRGALVAVCPATCRSGVQLHILDLRTGATRPLLDDALRGWELPTGHLMYVRGDGVVMAQPFDDRSLTLRGEGVRLFDGVSRAVSTPEIVLGDDGTLLYSTGGGNEVFSEVVWVDRSGAQTPVDPQGLPPGPYWDLALSAGGDRVALSTSTPRGYELRVKELPDGPQSRITGSGESGFRPDWLPGDSALVFVDASDRAWSARADGSLPRAQLLSDARGVREIQAIRDDGAFLVRVGTGPEAHVGVAQPGGDSVALMLGSDYQMLMPRLSPDGRWVAYVSAESGQNEVYVRPFPSLDRRMPVSLSGGVSPVWGRAGSQLFYGAGRDGEVLTVAEYETDPTFRITSRVPLFTLPDLSLSWPTQEWRFFDTAPDDQRFMMLRPAERPASEALPEARTFLVQGFFTQVEALLGR